MTKKKEVFMYVFTGLKVFEKSLLARLQEPDKKGYVIGTTDVYLVKITKETETERQLSELFKKYLKERKKV